MNNFIWIKVKTDNYNKLLTKINNLNINIYDIKYINEGIKLKVEKESLKRLKKYLVSYKFDLIKSTGLNYIKNIVSKNKILFACLIIGIVFLFFLSNLIVDVDVIHSKKEIRDLVYYALDEKGIKELSFKKGYKEIEKIKKEILNEYPDKLEWLEIETHGMRYIIRVEERIINKKSKTKDYCHVVASKSGIVTRIKNYRGMAVVDMGDYVSKGDILVSGEVKHNEEIKANVCANAKVYGEVWYTIKVSLPLEYKVTKKTEKMRYNLYYESATTKKKILRSRVLNPASTKKLLFNLDDHKLYLTKEYETIVKNKKYTEEEAISKGLEIAKEKLLISLDDDEKIISQKVLKKSINNGKMDMEVFTSVEENIGVSSSYVVDTAKENANDMESS